MTFQWLTMRIAEEQERRQRESQVMERLPRAFAEIHQSLKSCIDAYAAAFGAEAAEIRLDGNQIHAAVREERDGAWQVRTQIEMETAPMLPGFRIASAAGPVEIHVGMLPGDRLFYKHGERYLTMEQLTRLILDRAFFPKLGE